MTEMTEADQIRILIATDSHVGYAERDPIRKDDSWKSFAEIMKLAKDQDVDMVLLAGDLFHENKPSRKSMYQVMLALRENCLGPKPCELQWLSDGSDVLRGGVNYEDVDINVAIPVFSIHGNHDDPSGDGHLCALDLLEVSGLLNYFGRTPEADNIKVKPLLLQKGQTKLALYGMSNVRDERLFRTFRDHKVTFFEPNVQKEDWFNIMAVHQNHHAHNDTGYLPENFLPDFLDLVVWGHEHECLIDPRENPETGFKVMQPGSSVATSLVEGEAKPKHVAIITVTGKDFEIEKFPIKSVRPFIVEEIKLAEDPRFKGLARKKNNKNEVSAILKKIVREMITEAINRWCEIQDEEPADEDIPKPLVRLKVDYSSTVGEYEIENPQRFSNGFVNEVANVNDVIAFSRKKAVSKKKEEGDKPDQSALSTLGIDDIKVDKLVQQFLEAQSLKILPQAPFSDAVTQYVVKSDKDALDVFVNDALTDQVQSMLDLEPDDEEDLDGEIDKRRMAREAQFKAGVKATKRKVKYHPQPDDWDSEHDGDWHENPRAIYVVDAGDDDEDEDDDDDMEESAPVKKPPPAKKAPAKRAPAKTTKAPAKKTPAAKAPARGRKKSVVSDDDDEDDDDDAMEEPAPVKKAPAKKAPAAKAPARGRKKPVPFISDDDAEDDDVIMLDEEEPAPKKSQPKRAAATRGAAASRQTQLTFSQQPSRASQKPARLSEDEISNDEDVFEPPAGSSRRR